uniref:MyTH4 domain-containing protein n=1 Tax=Tetraodon nigroviridis TaxID=99883 RepID=H3C6Q0_TETNG
MAEFATKYFRYRQRISGIYRPAGFGDDSTHTGLPIKESLILYSDPEINNLSVQCFKNLMQFMGDVPMARKTSHSDCLRNILLGKEKELLRDEIYCQIIKQTINNSNQNTYFFSYDCVFYKYPPPLRVIKYNKNFVRCIFIKEAELKRIFTIELSSRYLKFKLIPTVFFKLLSGFVMFPQIQLYPRLADAQPIVFVLKVAADVIAQICKSMGVSDLEETKEFSLLASRNRDGMVHPLQAQEYLLDVLADDNSILLSLRRVTWNRPLSFSSDLYVDFHYQQLLSDYLSGQLMLGASSSVQQTAELSALQHLSQGRMHMPSAGEIKEYLPPQEEVRRNIEEIYTFCVGQVAAMHSLSPQETKIKFIEILTTLPLFGANIFTAQKVSQRGCPSPCMVSLGQEGVLFLHPTTQERIFVIPLADIQSMRAIPAKKKGKFPAVDIYFGNSSRPKKITINLQQGKEFCHTLSLIIISSVLCETKFCQLS